MLTNYNPKGRLMKTNLEGKQDIYFHLVHKLIHATLQPSTSTEDLYEIPMCPQLRIRDSETAANLLDLDLHGTDPLGILEISSFYGPGSWAAWFMTPLCVLYCESAFSCVSYFSYTTFAWIDLLIRYHRVRQRDDPLLGEHELGSFAAAYTILWASAIFNSLISARAMITRGQRQLRMTKD